MANIKALIVLAATLCGSIMEPTPGGQLLSVVVEKTLGEQHRVAAESYFPPADQHAVRQAAEPWVTD
ncbi:hypothetical protein [Geomonas sp.]|uniref:hypothetical protein n=1 Tax=Geomonas sp. TaxID=2651584 RepID=UPI002B4A9F98|nr:hypothetical protein [Geomonas sp.]HJV33678.1 hypothetical protein [Geomonas sp.]